MRIFSAFMLIFFCLAHGAFAQDEKISVLLLTGGHGFDRPAFFEMMDALDMVEYKELAHPNANAFFLNPEGYDVILFYDMVQEISDEEKEGLEQLVAQGIGLVFLHHSIVSYQDWDFYREILGGRYIENGKESQPQSNYKHDVQFNAKVENPDHPIMQGLEDFDIFDEVYGQVFISTKVFPLISSSHPESMEYLMWAHEPNGKTRSVYLQPGHGPSIFGDPNYRKILKQSLEWAAFKR